MKWNKRRGSEWRTEPKTNRCGSFNRVIMRHGLLSGLLQNDLSSSSALVVSSTDCEWNSSLLKSRCLGGNRLNLKRKSINGNSSGTHRTLELSLITRILDISESMRLESSMHKWSRSLYQRMLHGSYSSRKSWYLPQIVDSIWLNLYFVDFLVGQADSKSQSSEIRW